MDPGRELNCGEHEYLQVGAGCLFEWSLDDPAELRVKGKRHLLLCLPDLVKSVVTFYDDSGEDGSADYDLAGEMLLEFFA